MNEPIRVRGARQHNLKGVDVDLPRRALTVVTGPSGSGKSSLALDTVFAAGQRRYVEALSTYAKQFLDRLDKPQVDRIEGLCPAVAIEQRNPATSARSTVGTATEVHDYLRLLYARVGRTHCPSCSAEVLPDSVTSATDRVAALPAGTRFTVGFPLARSSEVSHRLIAEKLRAMGFSRVVADGVPAELSALLPEGGAGGSEADGRGRGGKGGRGEGGDDRDREGGRRMDRRGQGGDSRPDLASAREVMVVVDRLVAPPEPDQDWRDRVADSLATCFREGEGQAVVTPSGTAPGRRPAAAQAHAAQGKPSAGQAPDAADGAGLPDPVAGVPVPVISRPDPIRFSDAFRCARHPEHDFLEPQPKLFSFNNPYGSCPVCTGFGATLEYDPSLIVPDPAASLDGGAVDPWAKPRYGRERDALRRFAAAEGASVHVPWQELAEDFRQAVLHGKGEFTGVIDFLRSRESKRYKQYIRVFLRRYQSPRECPACRGARLRPEALLVTVGGMNLAQATRLPIHEVDRWLAGLALRPMETRIAATILRELGARVRFLVDVGLGYLSLDRQMRTLSGGEAQRIALAGALGSRLTDTLYVLDEPSVGLHPRDVEALLALLTRLRDDGNTVLVVEHDPQAIRAADHVVELGPGAGDLGGEVVFEGPPRELSRAETATGRQLGREGAPRGQGVGPSGANDPERRPVNGPRIRLLGASLHNVRDVDADFPLGAMTVVSGVSGSGKSTLVHDILFRALEAELNDGGSTARLHLGEAVGSWHRLEGARQTDGVVLVDQSPIGRTPRSNPVTYIQGWGEVRRIFASQPAARAAGMKPGSFSFNVAGGRCEACSGAGAVRVEMVFMADVHVLCEHCGGSRYRPEVLEVKVRGQSVADVLEMTVDRAIRFFLREPKLGHALWQLQQVGLGYLRLGQPASHLSGGEAQRLKIARELSRAGSGERRVYILDEPTTGLSGGDVAQLLRVLHRLTRAGHTLVVVEHDLQVIRAADWVIDMGPGAGEEGGGVVAMGRPEDVAKAPDSVTGRFLAGRG